MPDELHAVIATSDAYIIGNSNCYTWLLRGTVFISIVNN